MESNSGDATVLFCQNTEECSRVCLFSGRDCVCRSVLAWAAVPPPAGRLLGDLLGHTMMKAFAMMATLAVRAVV